MKKLFFALGFVFLIAGAIAFYMTATPLNGHTAEDIYVNVQGNNVLLQDALDQKILLGTNLSGGNPNVPDEFGHIASEILVNVSGRQKTLQEAVNSGTLCSTGVSLTFSNTVLSKYHTADNVLIRNSSGFEKNLQAAINERDFCTCGNGVCQANYGENCTSCSSDCGSCGSCPQVSELVDPVNTAGYFPIYVTFPSRQVGFTSYGIYNDCPPANAGTGIVGSATRVCVSNGNWGTINNNLYIQNNLCNPNPPYNRL